MVGAVGPKIIFPNGRLQEAGCTIAANATTEMVGVLKSPPTPGHNYSRDVDYVVRRCIDGAAFSAWRHAV